MKSLISTIIFLFLSAKIHAQVDPSSALLLRQGRGSEVSSDAAYGSGRFVVQPAPSTPKPADARPVEVKKPTAAPDTTKVESAVTGSSRVVSKPAAPVDTPAVGSVAKEPAEANAESSEYFDRLQANDVRINLVQISVSPTVFNVASSSDYWFYDYQSDGAGLFLAADVWVTPEIGIHADYMTSFASGLNAEVASGREIVVEHTMSTIALQFRTQFGTELKAPYVIFGIGVSEQTLSVPKAETQRIGNKTSAVNLHMKLRKPDRKGNAWIYEVEFLPSLKIEEVNTAVTVRAGDDHEGQGIRLSFGKEIFLDRKNQVYWRLSHRYDQIIYDGQVSLEDPRSEETPSDISVNRGTTVFEFGYIWGD